MPKESIIFKISGTAWTLGVEEAKKEGWWARLTNRWTPGKIFLTQRVERKNINGKGEVSVLKIELVEQGKEEIDVAYEWLLDGESLNKNFAIQDLELDKTEYQAEVEHLIIPRAAYYNIVADVGDSTPPADLGPSNWTLPADATIDGANDADLNRMVDEYNKEIKENRFIRRFKYFKDKGLASHGAYYELKNKYNDYYENTMPDDAKKDISKALKIGEILGTTARTADEVKDELKRLTKHYYNTVLPAILESLSQIDKWVKEWRDQGNLTDGEHNQAVEDWQKSWDENETVKNYQALVNKVANEAKYSKHKTKFEEESNKEVNGAKANQDLAACGTPAKIADADILSYADAALARKKTIKDNFKNIRQLKTKILARKQAVIDLIEDLVKNEGQKLKCPQCNLEFDTLPEVWNGVNYCSQACSEKAKQGGSLSQAKTAAIQAINNALSQGPAVATSELDTDYRNWETKINGFNKAEEVNNFKDLVLANIKQKREQKKSNEEIDQLADNLPNKSGSELINDLKKLAGYEEKTHYQTKKTVINQAEDKAWTEDATRFKNLVQEIVEAKMAKCGIAGTELGNEEKKIYLKIKNQKHNDKDQLKKDRQKLVAFVGNKEIEKKINNLQQEVNSANSEEEKKKVKTKLLTLLHEDNIYVESHKKEIRSLIQKLDSNPTNNPDSFPWKTVLSLTVLGAVVVIGVALLIRYWRLRQEEKNV